MEVRTLLKTGQTSLTSCTKDATIIIVPKVHPNGLSDGIVQHLCTEDVVPVQVQGSVVVVDGLQALLSRGLNIMCAVPLMTSNLKYINEPLHVVVVFQVELQRGPLLVIKRNCNFYFNGLINGQLAL